MQNNLTIFTNFKRQIFADLISGIYCGDLYFNKNENKAIFMEKNCDRFAKNCRNKYPQIFISLS